MPPLLVRSWFVVGGSPPVSSSLHWAVFTTSKGSHLTATSPTTMNHSQRHHHCDASQSSEHGRVEEWTTKECFQDEHQLEETLSRRVQGKFRATYAIGGMDPKELSVYTRLGRAGGVGGNGNEHFVVIEKPNGWLRRPSFKCELSLPGGLRVEDLTCHYRSDEFIRQGSLIFHAPFADPLPNQSVPISRRAPFFESIAPYRLYPHLISLRAAVSKALRSVAGAFPRGKGGGLLIRYTILLSQIVFVGCIFCIFAETYPYLVRKSKDEGWGCIWSEIPKA